jgi:hypothetical protein
MRRRATCRVADADALAELLDRHGYEQAAELLNRSAEDAA